MYVKIANMSDLRPKFCQTVTSYLIHKNKILLVKHKKLGIWIMPGGHIDEGELPYEAAEREFQEETNIKVRAKVNQIGDNLEKNNFVPNPFISVLAWISKENYDLRMKGEKPNKKWPRGCEKHFDFGYLVEPTEGIEYKQNINETDGIDWFSFEDIDELDTYDDIKESIKQAFRLSEK
jgi:8-oxo-dGTP pyrophosphatase MutT (NUDIX family)